MGHFDCFCYALHACTVQREVGVNISSGFPIRGDMDLTLLDFSALIQQLHSLELSAVIPDGYRTRSDQLYKPEIEDLYRIYRFIVDNSVLSVLEFGSGWSTLAIYLALHRNRHKFESSKSIFDRFPNTFKLVSVDASKYFFEIASDRVKRSIGYTQNLYFHQAEPRIEIIQGTPVSIWRPSPNYAFDFIYIDAPEPEQLEAGSVDFSYTTKNDPPISGDLLAYEPYLLPMTSVLIDGRTTNARFLESRLSRNWTSRYSFELDFTLLTLNEDPIGKIHKNYLDLRRSTSHNEGLNFVYDLDLP